MDTISADWCAERLIRVTFLSCCSGRHTRSGRPVLAAWSIASPSRGPRGILNARRGRAEQERNHPANLAVAGLDGSGLSGEPCQSIRPSSNSSIRSSTTGWSSRSANTISDLIPPPRAKVAHLHQPPPPEEEMTDAVRDKFSLYNVALEVRTVLAYRDSTPISPRSS